MTGPSTRSVTADCSERQGRLRGRYESVRGHSQRIASLLRPEDCVIQSMPDVSPIRWHLAHTTWFFETFVLKQFTDYTPVNDQFEYLFNSYYDTVGEQFPRNRRGLLSRPFIAEILDYRREVDRRMLGSLDRDSQWSNHLFDVVELGLQHEQQHQELMLTDIKHVFSCNPLFPAMVDGELQASSPPSQQWVDVEDGLYEIGHDDSTFAFDNESPRHRVFLEPYQLSNRLVTNGEFLEFVEASEYRRPDCWLSLGWNHVSQNGWIAPLNWIRQDDRWHEFTLGGLKQLDLNLPVTHISYFEADAFARWSGVRLATEAEWEVACGEHTIDSRCAEDFLADHKPPHPTHDGRLGPLHAMFGSVWQWASSSYAPYPGYKPPPGALGEYNGKFMCNQYVLRGGSCATSRDHTRRTYRNFFPPETRWQFTGIRLARESVS